MDALKAFLNKYRYFILICFIIALSVAFRAELYFLNRQFWPDEIALADNFIKNDGFLWAFAPLEYFQMAPPLFLIATKFSTIVFGSSEQVFRLIPFLASLVSILVFFILSKEFLKTKRAIIFANFLYAINFALIRYSSEFKQYSSDVLIFMAMILLLSKINIEKLTITRALLYGVGFAVLFFISQPSVFLLFGFIFYQILNIKNAGRDAILKLLLIPVLPLLFILFYKISSPDNMAEYMQYYWKDGFLSFGGGVHNTFFVLTLHLLRENLNFFFYGIKCLYFLSPLLFIGFFYVVYDAFSSKKRIGKIFLLSCLGLIFASILHLYPILNRLILFLFPFFIIFIAKCFDFRASFALFNKVFSILTVIFVLLFSFAFSLKIICKNRNDMVLNCCHGRDLTEILSKNFNTKKDVIIVSKFNECFYDFYKNTFKLVNLPDFSKIMILSVPENKSLIEFFEKLNISEDKNYWVYIPCNSLIFSMTDAIKKLEDEKKIKVFYKIQIADNSYLYKIKGQQNSRF